MRKLIDIIDQITEAAPDLRGEFSSLRSSILHSAPEPMSERWRMAALILSENASGHPKKDEIAKIFSGAQSI